jgi:hypothetical protein
MTLGFMDPEYEIAAQDIRRLIGKYSAKLSKLEVLALTANLVGKMIALQDDAVSPSFAMEIVSRNITHGNKQMLDEMARVRQGRQ